jgi:peptide/nickel transport system permease protein
VTDLRLGAGAGILAAWALIAALAPVLPLRDPNAQPDGLVLRNLAPMTSVDTVSRADGSTQYAHEIRRDADGGLSMRRADAWTRVPNDALRLGRARFYFGTDSLGRDLLSRLVWGARVSLVAGLLAALVAVSLGGGIGLAAGFAGGRVDALLMRATDGALAIPRLFLLLLLAALFRPALLTTVLLVGCTTWMAAARLVRGEAQSIREREFVAAARAAGASPIRVAMHHVLPHAAAVLGVEAALRLGQAVLLEASLSFLGLGVPPPAASWGGLIADGRDRLLDAWWIATWPGLALAGVVIAASLLADGARERL